MEGLAAPSIDAPLLDASSGAKPRLVVRMASRQGRMTEVFKSQGDQLRVGRSYSNELILTDPYVGKNQLHIRYVDGNWLAEIVDTTNPVMHNGKLVNDKFFVLASKDKVTLGRTHLSFYDDRHQVSETRKLAVFSRLHRLHSSGLSYVLAMFLLIAAGGVDVSGDYLQAVKQAQWKPYLYEMLTTMAMIVFWACLWALVGKVVRHHYHFNAQLIVTSLMFILIFLVAPFSSYLEYFSNSVALGEWTSYLTMLAGCVGMFKLNLMFATNIKHTLRVGTYLGVSFVGLVWLSSYLQQADFSPRPSYSLVVKPHFFPREKALSAQRYWQQVEALIGSDADESAQAVANPSE